jgi:hypothetical protein
VVDTEVDEDEEEAAAADEADAAEVAEAADDAEAAELACEALVDAALPWVDVDPLEALPALDFELAEDDEAIELETDAVKELALAELVEEVEDGGIVLAHCSMKHYKYGQLLNDVYT